MQTVRETAQAPTGVIAGDTSSLSASQLIVDSKQISFACEGPPYNFYTVRCRQEDPTMVENANRLLDALGPFIERLDAAGDLDCNDRLDALKNIFSDAVTALGFKYFTYHVVRARAIDPAAGRLPHIISTYPDAWVRHYFREQYLDEDPVLGELMRRHSPFIWAEIARPDNLSHRQRRLFDEAQDAGIINGVTFPLHNGSEIASISLIPSESGSQSAATIRHQQSLIYLMARHYHSLASRPLLERSLTGKSSRRHSLLSPREKEVLEWAAKGKSAWEISTVLGISYKSIEFHMEGAKRKLQVYNRTHAVTKAIVLGLLSLD
jgi:LuxR family transcriptional activator of conjugal transfer of Ti plasmids